MKALVFYVVIFGICLPPVSSQPTCDYDDIVEYSGVQEMFTWIKNEMSQLKTLISQRDDKGNVTRSSRTYALRDRLNISDIRDVIFRGYYTAVFISTRISRSSVDYQPEAKAEG